MGRPWGPKVSDRPFIRVLVFTGEAPREMQGMMDELLGIEDEDFELVVVCNATDTGKLVFGPRASIRCFPGESIFDLRTHMAALSGEARWIVLLEGHNRVPAGWLSALRRQLALLPDSCSALVGDVDNRTSVGLWSWASFIHTFAFHWRPVPGDRAAYAIANTALRRALLPAREWRIGEFEVQILPDLMGNAVQAVGLAVDHVQHRDWIGATATHWGNGRMTGALMAARHPLGRAAVRRHAWSVAGGRMRSIKARLESDAARRDLPPGTLNRVRWLAVSHAAGALWGSLFGPGRSAERLV